MHDRAEIVAALRGILEPLASQLGNDASGIGEDDIIRSDDIYHRAPEET